MSVSAVVFDLDGVIVKTNFVKHDAMLSLFADHPEEREAISKFILANGGVPRKEKLAHLLRKSLRLEPSDMLLEQYLRRYAVALEHQLAAAPLVEGVAAFIATSRADRYVCSSAPEEEVHEQVAHRSLRPHFAAIYGGATPKACALRAISAGHPMGSVVFFGDSVGDYEAARLAGVGFVGVVCERNNFAGMTVVELTDFADRAAVERAMHRSLQQRAA